MEHARGTRREVGSHRPLLSAESRTVSDTDASAECVVLINARRIGSSNKRAPTAVLSSSGKLHLSVQALLPLGVVGASPSLSFASLRRLLPMSSFPPRYRGQRSLLLGNRRGRYTRKWRRFCSRRPAAAVMLFLARRQGLRCCRSRRS